MRVGIVLPMAAEDWDEETPSYATNRAIAVAAEAAGLDSIWVFDHLLFRFEEGVTTGIHEAWTLLAAIAEATSRVELGTLVMCTGFRNAALLAKMAATLDHISEGRLILGLGAGWHDPEYDAFGYPKDHKVSRFEESLAVITSLIRTGRADLDGTYVTARDAVLVPPARADMEILVAAKKPRMLELTARHADSWNIAWFGEPDERLATIRADLEAACARVERDPATLAVTTGVTVRYPGCPADREGPALAGDPANVARGLAAHAEVGVAHVIANLEPCTPTTVASFASAVSAWREAERPGL
jgi:alkanesulfonate monooxygenase SsuD/methylene tetrahydromethanopterin reductase-like flavin-dependent oxidoreductase (luciferase family)